MSFMADVQKIIDEQIGKNVECGEDGTSIYKQIGILREAVVALKDEVEKLSKKSISVPELDALNKKVEAEKGRAKQKTTKTPGKA